MADNDNLHVQALPAYFRPILAVCPLWAGKKLHPCIIANPHSGGFTIKKRSIHHREILKEAAKQAAIKSVCTEIDDFPLHETEYPGHASFITREIIDDALKSNSNHHYLIITAGGDGTSLEVQTALLKAALEDKKAKKLVKEHITVLKLPFGTGNDGSDGRLLEDTLRRLTEPSEFCLQSAIKVYYEGTESNLSNKSRKNEIYGGLEKKAPWYAFNIASVGIDAYITYCTNKFHNFLPGDFYKLFVNLSCLFYSFKFPSGKMHIDLFSDDGTKTSELEGNALFCLLGVSGNRTYGGGQKILPDHRNFCFTKEVNNFRKLLIKKRFLEGTHIDTKYAIMGEANIVKMEYDKPILVQMDGEVHHLESSHFPLIMELTEPIIRTIKLL